MKYTTEQLRAMAKVALVARDQGSSLWLMLVMGLALQLRMEPVEVERRIVLLADGVVT